MSMGALIACLGAGRMARGIAVTFAYAGHPVAIVDVKRRDAAGYAHTAAAALAEVRGTLATLASFGLFAPDAVDALAARVSVLPEAAAGVALADAAVSFERVPEVVDLKREVFTRIS